MFFKPQWYRNLPDSVKPIDDKKINKIEDFRIKSEAYLGKDKSQEMIFIGIMVSKWAVKRIQQYTLELIRKQIPNAHQKELWKQVLLARLNVKLSTSSEKLDMFSRPLSETELLSRINNIDEIVVKCESFNDVMDYIITMDEHENRFYDPTGMQSELESILNSKNV